MKLRYLILAIFFAFGCATVPPPPEQVNIPKCPPENAYIFDGTSFWHLTGGRISDYYNTMTLDELKKEAAQKGSPLDLKQCPPAVGHLQSGNRGINIPMGFFDDKENWFNEEQVEKLRQQSRNKKKKSI